VLNMMNINELHSQSEHGDDRGETQATSRALPALVTYVLLIG